MKHFFPYLYIPAGIYLAWMVHQLYKSGAIAGGNFRISRRQHPSLFFAIMAIAILCVVAFWVVGTALVIRQAALDGILF